MIRHTAAYENQRADGPKAGDLAKPSTAAINQATPPAINNSRVTRKKKFGCVARSCCSSTMRSGNISVASLLYFTKTSAVCARKAALGCAQTTSNWGRGSRRTFIRRRTVEVGRQKKPRAIGLYVSLPLCLRGTGNISDHKQRLLQPGLALSIPTLALRQDPGKSQTCRNNR